MYLFFDTETIGLPANYNAPVTDFDNWPRIVELGWELYDKNGRLVASRSSLIYPCGFLIPQSATDIHGVTQDMAERMGVPLKTALSEFDLLLLRSAKYVIAHNASFDTLVLGAEFHREGIINMLGTREILCTKELSTGYCAIPGKYGFKWPKLVELYKILFGRDFGSSHSAIADVRATAECFFELKKRGVINY